MKRTVLILLISTLFVTIETAWAATSKSIRFQVTNGIYNDEALLGFYPNALDEFDPYDSHKFTNNIASLPEIFFLASGSEVAINGVPSLIVNKTLALGFRTGVANTFTIKVTQVSNLDAGTTILLRDNLLGVEQELSLSAPYTFTSTISTTSTRFTLFISKPLGKATATDRSVSDQLGSSVTVSGDYAAVGNNPADSTGAVTLFKRNSTGWSQVQKITASDIEVNDHFGCSVALCNDYLAVGAHGESEDVLGGNTLSAAGSVYLFRNNAGTWTQIRKITATDRSAGAHFGKSVSLSGNYLLVGAPNEDSGTGSAYVYKMTDGSWSGVQKITASDKHAGDFFGNSVSISDKNLLVGAVGEEEDSIGGNPMASAGSAYLFQNTAGTWSQIKKMVASDRAANDRFGCSVALSGEYAVVGADYEDEDAAGANPAVSAGSAYVFKNNAGTWSQAQKIVAADRALNDHFGSAVAISGNFILVGASNENEDARGFNTLTSAGSAYLFKNNAGTWTQNQKFNAADRESNDLFGSAVGFSGKNGIIGNPKDAQDALGANNLPNAGSVSFFRFDPPLRTWNGSSWGTLPTASDSVVLASDYNGTGFSCLDMVLNAGKKMTLTSSLNVFGNLTLKSDATNGTASFLDNGNAVFVANGARVEQYLTGAGAATPTGRFWYLSSPLSDATSIPFALSSVNPLTKFWSFSEASVAYTQITDRVMLNPGTGYVARLGNNRILVLTGTELNTGDQFVPITYTGHSNAKRGFNLIGNPYPSQVELDLASNPGIESTLWYRSLTSSGTNMVFDTYNLTSNTSVVSSGSGQLTRYIPPMQAFWIKKSAEGSSDVVFQNAKRSHQTGVSLRSSESESIRLQVTDGTQSDETLIGFYPNAKTGFDPYDSHKISNENALIPEIFSLAGTEEVAINGLPRMDTDTVLQLGFRTGKSGSFTLKVKDMTCENVSIVLQDKLLNITQDLLQNPTYTFQSPQVTTAQRFSLMVNKTATQLPDQQTPTIDVMGTSDHRIVVRWDGKQVSNARVTVYDALGRSQSLSNQVFEPGIYIVRITDEGYSSQKKVRIGQ